MPSNVTIRPLIECIGVILNEISKQKDAVYIESFNDEPELNIAKPVSIYIKIGIAVALIATILISFGMGRFSINPKQLVETLYNHYFNVGALDHKMDTVLFNIRLPRILAVVLVGAALSSSGAAYQGMFRNPLVSPDLLGASAGASFGASLALVMDWNVQMIQISAFLGGIIAVECVMLLERSIKYDQLLGLVLSGIMVGTLCQAGVSLMKFTADASNKLPELTFWLMGGFAHVSNKDFLATLPFMVIGFAILWSQRWKLNVLSFGDEEATSLGINVRMTRRYIIIAATLLVSASVAISGIIGWVGLVIPHVARAIAGPNYKNLIPVSMFTGAIYLLIVDDICRLALSLELPIGIATAILGVPFFIFIFKHNMKGW